MHNTVYTSPNLTRTSI